MVTQLKTHGLLQSRTHAIPRFEVFLSYLFGKGGFSPLENKKRFFTLSGKKSMTLLALT